MAYPLTGSAQSGTVRVRLVSDPARPVTATRVAALFGGQPRSGLVNVLSIGGGTTVVSGGAAWPVAGQGWPRITQR